MSTLTSFILAVAMTLIIINVFGSAVETIVHENTHYWQIKSLGVQNATWRWCEPDETVRAFDYTSERNVTQVGHCFGITQFPREDFYSKFTTEKEGLEFLHQSELDARSNEEFGLFIFEFFVFCFLFRKIEEEEEKNERIHRIPRV